MPTWWGARKSGKNKDDRCVNDKNITRGISIDNKSSGDSPLTPSRACTPRCSRNFAVATSGFSGFDSDEKTGHPLPRPSPHNDHVSGSTSGSASVSSVSSSGSAEDQSQLPPSRGHCDVKFNGERASPRGGTMPTSPLHNRLSGVSLESSTKRNDDGRSSEFHPLPLPPTSPTSPNTVLGPRIGGALETSPSGFSNWKKGKFLGSGTFGQVYQGFNR